MGGTIGDRLIGRAGRLVGRTGEIALFRRVLAGELDRNVLLVHGPGGIGKTELLRELARVARAGGRSVRWIDARTVAPLPGALGAAMRDVTAGTVVVVDGRCPGRPARPPGTSPRPAGCWLTSTMV
jgi:hypothetical protein